MLNSLTQNTEPEFIHHENNPDFRSVIETHTNEKVDEVILDIKELTETFLDKQEREQNLLPITDSIEVSSKIIDVIKDRTREYINNVSDDVWEIIDETNHINAHRPHKLEGISKTKKLAHFAHSLVNPKNTVGVKHLDQISDIDRIKAKALFPIYNTLGTVSLRNLNDFKIHDQHKWFDIREKAQKEKRGILVLPNHQHLWGNPWWLIPLLGGDIGFEKYPYSCVEKANFIDPPIPRFFAGTGKLIDVSRPPKRRKETSEEKVRRQQINQRAVDQAIYVMKEGKEYVHFIEGGRSKNRFETDRIQGNVSRYIKAANPYVVFIGHEGLLDISPFGASPEVKKELDYKNRAPFDRYFSVGKKMDMVVSDPYDFSSPELKGMSGYEMDEFAGEKLNETYKQALHHYQSREADISGKPLSDKLLIDAVNFIAKRINKKK